MKANCKLQTTNCKLQTVNYKLQIKNSNYKLQIEKQIANYKLINIKC